MKRNEEEAEEEEAYTSPEAMAQPGVLLEET